MALLASISTESVQPYSTPPTWACGGRIKAEPEDFAVDELPLYFPSGNGEHLYVRIWKRGMSTRSALQRLSEATGIPLRDMGFAGQKDTQAATTQWISLHTTREPSLAAVEGPDLRVLEMARHSNKLRRGHLKGNRFNVRIRDALLPPEWPDLIRVCVQQGFPNLFGPQRFGVQGTNAAAGRQLLHRLRGARRIRESERFEIHAYQAALFNALAEVRLRELGTMCSLLPGDIAVLHRNGASFAVTPEILGETQARAHVAELSPSAPLFGCRVALADGVPGTWEQSLLAREKLALEDFRFGTKDASIGGERRALRAFPEDFSWREEPHGLRLEFTLGPGIYATALLRELMKTAALDTPSFAADSE